MSEQIDGFLDMKASHGFNRNKVTGYRSKTIESNGFQEWTKNSMYKSSYAHFHSKVILTPSRIPPMEKIVPFLAMEATSPPSKLKTSTPRATPPSPNRASTRINLAKTPSDFQPPASTSTGPTSSTTANWPPAINTARLRSREPTPAGM